MKDWKAIAKAEGLEIPVRDIESIAPGLDALEAAFRPLANGLTWEIAPAIDYRAEEEGE
jgi:hypothetical protein